MTLEGDRALLDAFRRGEKHALARVFRLYVDDVTRTLRSGVVVNVDGQRTRLGQGLPDVEIEALVQETFVKAFQHKARLAYDGVRPYGAWLATIARNLLIDRARAERRDARLVGVDDWEAVPQAVVESEAAAVVEEGELARIIAVVKDRLEEPDKSIFRLRVEEQMSFRETAKALGLTEIVVRRRDTRIRAALLDLLKNEGFLRNVEVKIGTSLLPRKKD